MVVIGAAVYIINVVVCDKEISCALHKIFLTRSLLIANQIDLQNYSSKSVCIFIAQSQLSHLL